MPKRFFRPEVAGSSEFQTAIIRILAWVLMMGFLALGHEEGVYDFEWKWFRLLFGTYFVWYLAHFLSVVWKPESHPFRIYLGLVGDVSGNGFAIFLSGNPVTPFVLVYIWVFLSQGTRYGSRNLALAAVLSVVSYSLAVTALDGWRTHPFEVGFTLFFLVILPLYQYALLRRLHRAKRAAEEATRARGNFLATMTHELRTPLSGVIGMAGLLRETPLNGEQQGYVDAINVSAKQLQSLIGDILDLSKIDAGKLELRQAHFDVRQSVIEVCRVLGSQALDRRLELVCRIAPEVPTRLLGDDLRFRQILFNLLGNAIKFTEQGEVVVEVRRLSAGNVLARGEIEVSVRDTGIGIPKDKLARIFDSFWQADDSTTRRHGGTGLGATIARDLSRLMGGAIGVESQEGEGSRFWVRLPLIDPNQPQPPRPPARLRNHRALCIEPNASAADALREALEVAGMTVESAGSVDAMAARQDEGKGPVSLACIADTPQGIDLAGEAQRLRQRLGHEVPVVFLHYPRRTLRASGRRNVLLDKPFEPRALWAAAMEALVPGAGDLEATGGGARGPAPTEPSGLHVLVAEDDNINARLIQSLLSRAGHRVTLMRDGEAALQAALGCDFDLAIVDLRMPRMDGLDFTRAWREHEARSGSRRRMPIVALTANVAEEARDACLEAGMDDFLTKPVDPDTLDELIARLAGGRY